MLDPYSAWSAKYRTDRHPQVRSSRSASASPSHHSEPAIRRGLSVCRSRRRWNDSADRRFVGLLSFRLRSDDCCERAGRIYSGLPMVKWRRPRNQIEYATAENSLMLFVYLLVLVPISLVLAYLEAPPILVFGTAALAIVPLAEWLRRATEQLAARVGSAIGGLLNITFGNMAELILAIVGLMSGHIEGVKATIT